MPSATQNAKFVFYELLRDLLLCLTIVIAFQLSILGESKEGTDSSGSLFTQLSVVAIFFGSLFLAMLGRISLRTILVSIAPMMAILLLALVSFLWSDYPSLTIRRSSRLVLEAVSLVLIALAYREKPRELLTRLFYLFGIITLGDAASWFIPSISASPFGFQGLHSNKNEAGVFFLCAIPLFALATTRYFSGARSAALLFLFIACGLFVLTQSKTALTVIVVGVPITLALRLVIQSDRFRAIAPFIFLAFFSVATLFVFGVGVDAMLDEIFGDPTLTGRVDIWQFALAKFDAEPLHGIGYGALWQTGYDIAEYLRGYNVILVNEAHNGYIDIMAQLGVLGLLSLAFFLIVVFIRLYRTMSHFKDNNTTAVATYALYLFISGLIYNITESSYFRTGISQWVMLVLVSTCATGRLVEYLSTRPRKRLSVSNPRVLSSQFPK